MKETDYRRKYKLEERKVEIGDVSLEQAIAQTMNYSTQLGNYHVRKKKVEDLVIFGRRSPIQMDSDDALLISKIGEIRDIPTVILRYGFYPKQIVVGYIQTPQNVSFEDYKRIRSDLEIRPHDLILAHFLDRISPALDKFPDTNVFFSPYYLNKPVYFFLRDRFLDRDYFLNPKRVRVQQIIGKENSWLREESVQERLHAQEGIKKKLWRGSEFQDLFV